MPRRKKVLDKEYTISLSYKEEVVIRKVKAPDEREAEFSALLYAQEDLRWPPERVHVNVNVLSDTKKQD